MAMQSTISQWLAPVAVWPAAVVPKKRKIIIHDSDDEEVNVAAPILPQLPPLMENSDDDGIVIQILDSDDSDGPIPIAEAVEVLEASATAPQDPHLALPDVVTLEHQHRGVPHEHDGVQSPAQPILIDSDDSDGPISRGARREALAAHAKQLKLMAAAVDAAASTCATPPPLLSDSEDSDGPIFRRAPRVVPYQSTRVVEPRVCKFVGNLAV